MFQFIFAVIESVTVSIFKKRGMIWFGSGSCLSKLERLKANSIEVTKIDDKKIAAICSQQLSPVRL